MIYHRTIQYTSPHASTTPWAGRGSWRAFVPGAFLIALGVTILLVPQLLVVLIASAFLIMGAVALAAGWRIRKMMEEFHDANQPDYSEVDPWFGTPVEELIVRFSEH